MKVVYRFDNNVFYVEDVVLQNHETVPSDCTTIKPQDGLYKGRFINGAWVEGETQENILAYAKTAKKAELNANCNQAIMGGFSSSALGTQHTYSSVLVDEIWYNATINRFNVDATYTTVQWKTTDFGYLAHTKEQFTQVFIDGHAFGDSQITKLNNLKSQVDSATTKADVDAITW